MAGLARRHEARRLILVDSSVWIDYFNGAPSPEANLLDEWIGQRPLLTGDLVYAEVLQGFRTEREFARAKGGARSARFRAYGRTRGSARRRPQLPAAS